MVFLNMIKNYAFKVQIYLKITVMGLHIMPPAPVRRRDDTSLLFC